MKRRITAEQLKELTGEQLQKLNALWKIELGDYMTDLETEEDGNYFVGICKYIKPGTENSKPGYPLLDIGQMIELLQDKCRFKTDEACGKMLDLPVDNIVIGWEGELCDVLWQAVKEVL